MWRHGGQPGAVRSARRPGSDLPGLSRRVRPARQLPAGHRATSSRRGIGALELALRQLRERLARRGAVRRRPASGRCPAFRGGSRLSPARPARRSAIFWKCCAAAGAGSTCWSCRCACKARGRPPRSPPAIELVNRLATADRRAGRRPRRRQPGRPVGVQRRDRGPRDPRLADPGRLGGRARDRRDAVRPGGRRAGLTPSEAAERVVPRRRRAARLFAAQQQRLRRIAGPRPRRRAHGWTRWRRPRRFAGRWSACSSWRARLDELHARGACAIDRRLEMAPQHARRHAPASSSRSVRWPCWGADIA